jgi:hypothetical protein
MLLDFSQQAKAPDFETESLSGYMPPIDLTATVGNEMLEAIFFLSNVPLNLMTGVTTSGEI